MTCEHRYIVQNIDGKGEIICKRCGDVRQDGLPVTADHEAIEDRIKWERKKRESPLWLPPSV